VESGNDEIAQLAANFNRMAAHLEEYRRSSLGELLQAQQAAQAAIDSIPDPVLVFASEGVLISANQGADRLLALGDSEGSIQPLARLEPALREAIETARAHVIGGRGPYSARALEDAVRVQTREGEAFLLPRATPVYSADGSVTAVTVILQDVTRLRRFGELTSDLVATAAHELRTPLTSLRMAIHLCLEETAGPLSAKQADLLYAAREDCERLHDTVNELLDLARLQGSRGELHRRRVDPKALVESVCTRLDGIGRERGVPVEVDLPPYLPAVDVDPDRIEVVLTNLVDNALKHSPAGSAVRVAASEAVGSIRIEVCDAGPGIPAEDRSRVFDKFYRLPTAPPGGSGLGLSIARELVLSHGGEIGVNGNRDPATGEERGALFWFTLPIAV
jgi:signal transduction histidine kinase